MIIILDMASVDVNPLPLDSRTPWLPGNLLNYGMAVYNYCVRVSADYAVYVLLYMCIVPSLCGYLGLLKVKVQ